MRNSIIRTRPRATAVIAAALAMTGAMTGAIAIPAAMADKVPPLEISPAFPYQAHYVEVHGYQMHYVDKGEGDPILFLHGQPTSSYLWRNIMPYLEPYGRVVAPDNIGFGRSDQPADLDYRYPTHYKFIEGFIDKLGLKNVTLVIHDWGSSLGLDYAAKHPDNVKGVAMMEAVVPPVFPAAS